MGVARRAYEGFVSEDKGGSRQEEYHGGQKQTVVFSATITSSIIDRVLGRNEAIPRRKESLEGVLNEVRKGHSANKKGVGLPGKDRRLSEARAMAVRLVSPISAETAKLDALRQAALIAAAVTGKVKAFS